MVTPALREKYLRLLAEHEMAAVAPQIDAFVGGLAVVASMQALKVAGAHLTASELGDLIGGSADVDVSDWRAHTQYRGGYTDSSPQVTWFWELVGGMAQPRRRALLRFATGSAAPPARGFACLRGMQGEGEGYTRFTITRVNAPVPGNALSALPRGHTCFNAIDLPCYPTRRALRTVLLDFDFERALDLDDDFANASDDDY